MLSWVEDAIPNEKPMNFHVFVPRATYINNARHWIKNRIRRRFLRARGLATNSDLVYMAKLNCEELTSSIKTHPHFEEIRMFRSGFFASLKKEGE